jgi:hypothetical protein
VAFSLANPLAAAIQAAAASNLQAQAQQCTPACCLACGVDQALAQDVRSRLMRVRGRRAFLHAMPPPAGTPRRR